MSNLEIQHYQNALVHAIWHEEDTLFDNKSLDIYRANIKANASRSLSISFPTVFQLVGEHFFKLLVHDYMKQHPLLSGDWGQWGEHFPAWLKQQASLKSYPYLHDCAQLDWLCHIIERSPNNQKPLLKHEAIHQQLEDVCLQYATGTQVVSSPYPIVDIWHAHHTNDAKQKSLLLEQANQKLYHQQGQNALVWRPKWKANVRDVDALEREWIHHSSSSATLSESLKKMADSSFSLQDWLPNAFSEGVVLGFTH